MVSIDILIAIISIAIALGSLVTAIVVMSRNRIKETKEETREDTNQLVNIGIMSTRLDSIDNGVRDLKADNRGFRSELTKMRDDLRDEMREIHDEARHGVELAEAAHRRLDRMGAEPDVYIHPKKGE